MIEEMTNHKRLHHNNQTIYLQTFDMKILKEKETYEKEKKSIMESSNFFDMRNVIQNNSHEKKENEEVI